MEVRREISSTLSGLAYSDTILVAGPCEPLSGGELRSVSKVL